MPSYLVTGASGQLGQCFRAVAEEFPNHKLIFINQKLVNLSRPETLKKFSSTQTFDGIINCAAFTDVDNAEKYPEKAYQVNSEGLKNLSQFAHEKALSIVNFSTDYVFDGKSSSPYKEDDIPNPINVYGNSKYKGEKFLAKAKIRYTTFRISWLFSPYGKNFVKTILSLSNVEKKIKVINDQWGCPTYGIDLARNILSCIEKPYFFNYNCYHYTQKGAITWFDFAIKIVSLKKSFCKIIPCSALDYPNLAKRPEYSVMDTKRIKDHLSLKPLTWEVALEDCYNRLEKL